MGSWEFERDQFIADREKLRVQSDLDDVCKGLRELGVTIQEVGIEFVAETVEAMQPNRFFAREGMLSPGEEEIEEYGLTEWLAKRLVARELEV